MPDRTVQPVDEKPPLAKLLPLGLQHVLVMYAGSVAVPLILGSAMKLPKDQVAILINADLFACGIATLIQSIGFRGFGIRMPVMMGVTFAAVGPMLAIAADPRLGLLGIYGAVIGAGLFGILVAPFISRLLPLFPPVVTGTIITVVGVSLLGVGVNWAAGGAGNPHFGDPLYLAVSLMVLLVILGATKYCTGFFANIAVLLGLIAGLIVAFALGEVSFAGVAQASWVQLVHPFQFGWPTFDPLAILTMCLVLVVVMIESTGVFLALGEVTDQTIGRNEMTRGLRADGLGTVIGGIFNTFPYTSFSQNVGLVGVTGVRSRWVTATGGVVMLMLGLFPKIATIVASVPQFVLGGAGIVMFGMICATGIRVLSRVDFRGNPGNTYVVAVSIGLGMIPLVSEHFFSQMPKALGPLLHSGILLASISAVLLNAYFNGMRGSADAAAEATAAGREAEAAH
ncbi:nucleobase:cation symporter-2 family protein [uncultured Reyranella sp.]|uniref:nucleobase:cation symporter-2 family protein n=1 Tax=uncultured Reyranella sp. TaxID=735512 RepID=UPI0025E7E155|nr:nucleobase:cation symporter-2 family protein [uncultured Reyranella sp.]